MENSRKLYDMRRAEFKYEEMQFEFDQICKIVIDNVSCKVLGIKISSRINKLGEKQVTILGTDAGPKTLPEETMIKFGLASRIGTEPWYMPVITAKRSVYNKSPGSEVYSAD